MKTVRSINSGEFRAWSGCTLGVMGKLESGTEMMETISGSRRQVEVFPANRPDRSPTLLAAGHATGTFYMA